MLSPTRWKILFVASLLIAPLVMAETEIHSRRGRSSQEPDYILKLGECRFDAKAGLEFFYDNNTNRSTDNDLQEEGPGVIVSFPVRIYWPINPRLTLDVDAVLGYRDYINGNGTDGGFVSITAPETIAVDVRVGDNGILSFIDTVSVNLDTITENAVDNTQDQLLLKNDAAAQYEVDLSSKYSVSVRAGRKDTKSLRSSDFDYRNRRTYYGTGSLGWQASSVLKLGPYASYRDYKHTEDLAVENNDADEYEAGVRAEYSVTDSTATVIFVGYQSIDIDVSNNLAATEDDADGVTAGLRVMSVLNDRLTQSVLLRYAQRLGVAPGVNYTEDFIANYYIRYRLGQRLLATIGVDWLHSKEQTVAAGETADTVAPNIALNYAVDDKLTATARYSHTSKDSDVDDRNYRRNRISLGLAWDF
jgi:hypothetical protein